MTKRYRCLSSSERTAVEELALHGASNGSIAGQLGINKSTVAANAKRVRRNGHTARPFRPGRPPKVGPKALRRLVRIVRNGRYNTLRELTTLYNLGNKEPISPSTFRRALSKVDFGSFRPVPKPYVGERNRRKRLAWARARRGWKDEWSCVLFTDESRFEVRGWDKHKRVWRAKGERWLPECLSPTFKSGRDSVMVWGGI